MSLPNSPADPYPEAFGWPWHGLIRRPSLSQITDPPSGCEIVLPSGATRPAPSGNSVTADFTWSHPFIVPGLPTPDMPSVEDQQWWNQGIRRGTGNWYWDRIGRIPCVRSGRAWHVLSFGFGLVSGGGLRAAALMQADDGTQGWIYSDFLGENPFEVPSEISRTDMRAPVTMHGGSGDRRLLMISYGSIVNVRAGIIELILKPDTGVIEAAIHAKYDDMHFVVSNTPGEAPVSYTIFYFEVGPPIVQPYGEPAPPGFTFSESYSSGGTSYSREEEYLIWAWYRPNGVVELVRMNHRYEVDSTFGYGTSRQGFEDTTERHVFSIAGNDVLEYVLHLRSDYNNTWPYTQMPSGSLTVNDHDLPLGMTGSTGNYRSPTLLLGPSSAVPFSYDYVDSAVTVSLPGAATTNLSLKFEFLSNALITMGYHATVSGVERRYQGRAVSPSGVDHDTYTLIFTSEVKPDQILSWLSGAWNPVTGEVRRSDINYRYNWV